LGLAGARDRPRTRTTTLTQATRARAATFALVALRASLSVAIAAGITGVVASQLPRSLGVSTDVVGYPTVFNFNVNRYLWTYGLWVVLFPVAAFALDSALSRLTGGQFPRLPSAPRPASAADRPTPTQETAVALFRTAFVGLVLGLEVAIAWDLEGLGFLLVTLLMLGVYVALALGIASLIARWREPGRPLPERTAAVNLFASPLAVLGLYPVSEATKLRVLDTGNVYEYPWFPWWLAIVVTACLVAVVAVAVRRAASAGLRLLERRALLLVAAPVLLFLVLARLPGDLGVIDFFHEGEPLAAGRLITEGAFPWRDVMFIHGLLHDVFNPWVGFSVFEDSRWGGFAGFAVLLAPLYWLGQYFLFVYLFGRNVLFLFGTQVAVVLGLFRDVHLRFALMPFALLLLAAVLRRPTWPKMSALAGLLALQAVISPETTIMIPACLAVLGFYELWSRDKRLSLRANFRRTLGTASAGALALAGFGVVLAALGTLDDFLFSYRTFFSDHTLTGGVPVGWLDTRFEFAAIAPVALVVLTIWFFTIARRTGRSPAIDDWVMAALAITVLLYYPKFLGRADVHVYQAFAVATPLLVYAVFRLITVLEDHAPRIPIRFRGIAFPRRNWITAVALAIVVALSPQDLTDRAQAIPERLSATADREPVGRSLGYLRPRSIDLDLIPELERALDRHLEPGDHLFDFSNNPMLFHYVLDRPPSTRYFHVSMAIRQHTQSDLVKQLERRRPKLVVFSSSGSFGLPAWDNISNQVRHYDVSEYILDHYRPVAAPHTFALFVRNDLAAPVAAAAGNELYFANLPCDWGYAPNFLTTGPEERDGRETVRVPFQRTDGVATVTGWGVDLAASAPAREVVAALGSRVLASATPAGARGDVAGGLGDQSFLRSGFSMIVPGSASLDQLRFYVLTRSGEARELVYGPESGLAPVSPAVRRVESGGRSFRVVPGGIHGYADTLVPEKQTHLLDVPPGAGRRYDWLEIRTRSSFLNNSLGLTDILGVPIRTISFSTLDRGRRSYWVQLGACSQWHGFRGNRLYLESAEEQQISEIRLVP
jgi:hypothetical protein